MVQARKAAKDETITPQVLAILAKSEDYLTRLNVVSNPNTPTDILLQLGREFPRELLDNPVFDLLFLEKINFIREIPYETFLKLVCEEGITSTFLELATEHPDERVKFLVALDSATPTNALKKLVRDNLNNHHRKHIVAMYIQIAGNPNVSEEILELLSKQSQDIKWARYFIQCHNIKIPIEILEKLLETSDEKIITYVANHPHTPKNIIEELFLYHSKNNINIIRAIASNPNTDSDILELIENSFSDRATLINIADHPNTPLNILEKLANNSHPWIRRGIAVRPDVPKSFLPRIVTGVVNSLFSRFSTLEKQKLLDRAVNDLQLAKKHSTSTSQLKQFTKHPWDAVRLAVAKNPQAPDFVLEQLAKDKEFIIPAWVAKHPNTSTKTLNILCKCPATCVERIAMRHPNISRVTKQRYYSGIQYK